MKTIDVILWLITLDTFRTPSCKGFGMQATLLTQEAAWKHTWLKVKDRCVCRVGSLQRVRFFVDFAWVMTVGSILCYNEAVHITVIKGMSGVKHYVQTIKFVNSIIIYYTVSIQHHISFCQKHLPLAISWLLE